MTIEIIQTMMSSIPLELVILAEIGIIIIIATIFAFLIRLFKQPLIPAYIIAGILIGPLVLGLIQNKELVLALSEIGVAFLIFTAGLEIKFKKLREVGKAAFFGGIFQIAILFFIAFLITVALGFTGKIPIYVGLVVAFSSTMVVVKLLSDKRELNSLHGRIVIGILLIQDIVAIGALAALTTDLSMGNILIALGKASIFAIMAIVLSKISNPIFKSSAKNQELLLLVSVSFLFLFAIGSYLANLSLIIGAFFAGVALANSDYKTEIQGKITPLREFFAVIFFVSLGMQLRLISGRFILLFVILFALVILIKPLIIMFLIRISGYKKRTSFLTGNSLAQTSEFSLILIVLGLNLGHFGTNPEITNGLFSTLVLLTIVTMALTNYCIKYEKKSFKIFGWVLNILDRYHSKKEDLEYHAPNGKKIIIFGCHRMGSLLLKDFEAEKKDIFVVDYNPEIIKSLISKKIPCIYGDFMNPEVLEKADIKNAEIIVSTIPDFEENILLTDKIRAVNKNALIFIVAERIDEAIELYKQGANYVILPNVLSGQKTFDVIKKIKRDKKQLRNLKKEQIKYLNSIHNILY